MGLALHLVGRPPLHELHQIADRQLRGEVRLFKEERDIPKNVHPVLCGPEVTRVRSVAEHGASFPTSQLCDVVGVDTHGLRTLRNRPASRRQRANLATYATIREQSHFSQDERLSGRKA